MISIKTVREAAMLSSTMRVVEFCKVRYLGGDKCEKQIMSKCPRDSVWKQQKKLNKRFAWNKKRSLKFLSYWAILRVSFYVIVSTSS